MKNKKGVELAFNTIIIAIICLIVLTVVLFVFSGVFSGQIEVFEWFKSCESKAQGKGHCESLCTERETPIKAFGCKGDTPFCCIPNG